MMGWTDRHERRFMRLLAPDAMLYTEMVTAQAVIHGDRERLLGFSPEEQPVALQLAGSCPQTLAKAAAIGVEWGYRTINLNLGCPSERASFGAFGACMMRTPALVRECVAAMAASAKVPITVKCRLGVDDRNSYEFFREFVDEIGSTGHCRILVVHARSALLLQGLSPGENRRIPPLRHEHVHRLKRERSDLEVIINGGIDSLTAAEEHLRHVDGVMIGRKACHDPWYIAVLQHRLITPHVPLPRRHEVLEAYYPYVQERLDRGDRLHRIVRHLLRFFHRCPGGGVFRRYLGEHSCNPDAGIRVLKDAARLTRDSGHTESRSGEEDMRS